MRRARIHIVAAILTAAGLSTTAGHAGPVAGPAPTVVVVIQPPPGVTVSAGFKEQVCGHDMSLIVNIGGGQNVSGTISIVRLGQNNPVVTPFSGDVHGGLLTMGKGPKLDCGSGIGPVKVSITYGPFHKLMFEQIFSPKTIYMSMGFGAPPPGPPPEKVRLQVVDLIGSCDSTTATMDAELEMLSASPTASAEAKMSFQLGSQPAQIVVGQIHGANQHLSAPAPLSCATGIPPLHYKLLSGLGGAGSVQPVAIDYK